MNARSRHNRGFTLTEVLVAAAVSGIGLAAALAGMALAQRLWREAQVHSLLHERAQYLFATLEPELQMAGFQGIPASTPAPAPWPAGAGACDPVLPSPAAPALRQYTGQWPLACPPHGGGMRPGSAVLATWRAASTTRPTAGALALADGSRELHLRIFYVAREADGDAHTPALRMKSLSAIAGEPAFIDTEVMPGVQDLQADLLPTPEHAQAVRLRLQLVADASLQRAGAAPAVLAISRHFALRNAPPG